MFDFTLLQYVWWGILGFFMILFSTTAGFDFGVTMIMPFLRKESDRSLALASIMPTWDGNLTWLVFIGGALFVIWPVVYGTAFSGLYFAMFCVLWPLFFRPPGFDYRDRIDNPTWRRLWDCGLLISSVFPVFVFGIAWGNCFLGFPFRFDPFSMREIYTGGFLDLFRHGFPWLCAFISLSMILMHGAAYLMRRVEGHIAVTAKRLHVGFTLLTLILFIVAVCVITYRLPGYHLLATPKNPLYHPLNNLVSVNQQPWVTDYQVHPWKFYPMVLTFFGIIIGLWTNYLKAYAACFWSSACTIGGIIASAGCTLFPFIMPSSLKPTQSLTIFDSTASQYALGIMLYVGVVLSIIILIYKIFAFYTVWHKKPTISQNDIDSGTHGAY